MAIDAYYDKETGKIHNATPGTFIYYHEEGHKFLRTEHRHARFFRWMDSVGHPWLLIVTVLLLIEPFTPAWYVFFAFIGYIFLDEAFANWYAFQKKRRK